MKSHAARSAIAFDFTYALISPSRLVQLVSSNGACLRRVAVVDRAARRGEHHALDLRVARRLQHAQRAVARRHDQLVFVLRRGGRHRRRDVDHVVAAGHGLAPAVVVKQVRLEERQAVVAANSAGRDRRPDLTLALSAAHRRTDVVPCLEQLHDDVTGNEPGASRDENHAHVEPLLKMTAYSLINQVHGQGLLFSAAHSIRKPAARNSSVRSGFFAMRSIVISASAFST